MKMIVRLAIITIALGLASGPALGVPLLNYDPLGPQAADTPLAPSFTAPGVSASDLSQAGFEDFWSNTDVLPVGRISDATTIPLGQYVSFTVSGRLDLESLTYSKLSYLNAGPTAASVRSSLDGFAADIDTLALSSASGIALLSFDLSSLVTLSSPTEFRIYFYGSPTDLTDWADLASSARGADGLTLYGTEVPEPGTLALLGAGLVGMGFARRKQI